jgi:hypothetical protein
MTLEIKRRYNFDEWEPIAKYRDGEFEGDDDFLDSFGHLEGRDEEAIMERFDGPNLLAMRPESGESGSEDDGGGDEPLADEIAQSASESLSEKLGSGAAGTGSATYGGAGDDEEDEDVSKEWVEDPTPEAPNRWVNTDTGEYRYQETKPGESADSNDEESGYSVSEEDMFGSVEEAKEVASNYFEGRIEDENLSDHAGWGADRSEVAEAWSPFISRMLVSGIDREEMFPDSPFDREDWQSSLKSGLDSGGVSAAWESLSGEMFGVSVHHGHSEEIAEEFTEDFIDDDIRETSSDVFDEWMNWSDEEGTKPLWALAVQETGNENVPDDSLLEDVDEEAVEDMREYVEQSREAFKNTFGEEITVHRALDGEIAEEITQAVENGEEVEIEHRSLEAWTTAPDFTEHFQSQFATGPGDEDVVVITDTIETDKIFGSSFDSPELARKNQGEVVVGGEGASTYSPEQIRLSEQGKVDTYSMASDAAEATLGGDTEKTKEEENSVGVTVSADESWYDWPRYALRGDDDDVSKEREYVDNVHEAPDGVVVRTDEDDCLYYEKSLPAWEVLERRRQQSLEKSEGFERIDDELMKFYTHAVWWGLEEQEEGTLDVSKAPEMWQSSEEVPEFVEEYIREAIQDDAFWQGRFDELPAGAEQHVQSLFEDKMTQPQGWSLGSVIDDLEDMYSNVDEDYLLMLTRNEVAAIANKAREEAYEDAEKEGETFEYYWSGPEDFRTTDVCSELKEETHPRFDGEPRPLGELKELMEDIAQKHPEGMLDRLDEWVPHFQCRHTFVRKVYL